MGQTFQIIKEIVHKYFKKKKPCAQHPTLNDHAVHQNECSALKINVRVLCLVLVLLPTRI